MRKLIDIVITHHDEPLSCGKAMFDMIEHQQNVDMNQVCVTLLQTGRKHDVLFGPLLNKYSYPITVTTLESESASDARNYAISHTDAEWILFCNFDDCFADICSLSMMLRNLPTDKCDVIWMKTICYRTWDKKRKYLNCLDSPNFTNVSGKLYRTDFLRQEKVKFNTTKSGLYDEHVFNSCVLGKAKPWRIMELTTKFYPYYKSYRPGSLRNTPEACKRMMRDATNREAEIAQIMQNGYDPFLYRRTIVKAYCMEYTSMYLPDAGEERDEFTQGFREFAEKHIDILHSFPESDFSSVMDEAVTERCEASQQAYNNFGLEYYFRWNGIVPFKDWLNSLRNGDTGTDEPEPIQIVQTAPEAAKRGDNTKRVVVYCGTYNVYMDMLASCKSLLSHTPVDKVYFLIEDDSFPEPLPDIVECINVKQQTFFKPDSPNYDNPWTYMCMIRTAFPTMFPQYDRILSLDIDVVIEDDISDLWDIDLTGYYLAGVPERQRQRSSDDPLYINFGVVLMNLAKLREDRIQPKLIDALNTRKIDCPEQGAYNEFCAGHIYPLSPEYNYTAYSHITGDASRQRIVHYAGQKFWKHYPNVQKYMLKSWTDIMEQQNKLKNFVDE